MKNTRISTVFTVFFGIIFLVSSAFLTGCESNKSSDLKLRNRSQQARIDELESQYNVAKLELEQAKKQLVELTQSSGIENEKLAAQVAVLEADVAAKSELIGKMQAELVRGGAALPPELASELEKFAASSDMITFDETSGMIKFKSDLLFEPGSDRVASGAISAIKQLCKIVNSKNAAAFDITIAGHTDDVPIGKPATRRLHPTNWHLSAHRAIAVQSIMSKNKVDSKRLSVRGFGQYRPIEKNKANYKGNAKNRRVEIYLVPAGM